MSSVRPDPEVSIVIAAHNEAHPIGRLLDLLTRQTRLRLQIIVVCNGCTDATAEVARSFGGRVTVLEEPTPSKAGAQRAGDDIAMHFPRIYLDADVEVSVEAIAALIEALDEGHIHACAPRRLLPLAASHPLVRWYYEVWQELPQVRRGLFGRGVIAVDEEGWGRLRALPPVLSDDLAMSEAFETHETRIVEAAEVLVHPPRTVRDLVRRRVRVATGTAEVDRAGLRGSGSTTTVGSLMLVAVRHPHTLFPGLPVFVAITVVARLRARTAVRRGDFSTWLRDESSRQ